ncbi:MAG TPA: triose-phosphate isomerase [Dongiaceae bacterium]|nr:triose-phosphate isomerase [Dongiaceae bacterium]
MRVPVVAGNWKMNGNRASVQALLESIQTGFKSEWQSRVLVCGPFPYLDLISRLLQDSAIEVGAQNLSEFKVGAYTGEVCGGMLTDVGCRYVIIGHSERRALYGETNQQVAAKFQRAQEAGLTPILCVGETLDQRQQGLTLDTVREQLWAVADAAGVEAFRQAILAYEPVWAIGTGLTATPQQAQEVHAALRERIASVNPDIAAELPILYGGSVKASNAEELFACPDIDGGLIGGASLDAQEFLAICRAAG